jgi:hypothetical protein
VGGGPGTSEASGSVIHCGSYQLPIFQGQAGCGDIQRHDFGKASSGVFKFCILDQKQGLCCFATRSSLFAAWKCPGDPIDWVAASMTRLHVATQPNGWAATHLVLSHRLKCVSWLLPRLALPSPILTLPHPSCMHTGCLVEALSTPQPPTACQQSCSTCSSPAAMFDINVPTSRNPMHHPNLQFTFCCVRPSSLVLPYLTLPCSHPISPHPAPALLPLHTGCLG